MKKYFFLLLLLPFCYSCSDDEVEKQEPEVNITPEGPDVMDVDIYALLRDASGNDLLDDSTEGAIDVDEIRVYPIRTDREIDRNHPQSVEKETNYDGVTYIKLFMDFPLADNFRSCYVQWTSEWGDTIRCKMYDFNETILDKVYVNGELRETGEGLRWITFTQPE